MMRLFVYLSALATSWWSIAPDAKPIIVLLEARYRAARTLQATFLERYSENGRLVRVEAGRAYFRKPGKMRWEYESPENNLFLVDGKTAWFYVPADHTVTRVPAKQSTDWRTPLALLAGEMKLDRVCARVEPTTDVKPDSADDVMLYCLPRGTDAKEKRSAATGTGLRQTVPESAIFLEVSRATANLTRVVLRDGGRVELEFKFANWEFDPPLSGALFRFEVPPGVAIVNGESPADDMRVRP